MTALTKTWTEDADSSQHSANLMRVACWVFGSYCLFAVLSARCLYADGSHEFLRVLQAGTFVELMKVRSFAFDMFELPLVLALKLGVTNMDLLRLAFGLGCFLPWPLALLVCYRLAPQHFWLAALACGAGYLNAAFMPVGEHIIAHALFWPAVFALVFVRPLTPFAAGALLVSAFILCRSYESLLFLGPPLAAIAWHRAFRGDEVKWQQWVLVTAGALFVLATIIAFYGVVRPEIPSNMTGFKQGFLVVLRSPSWTLVWSALWGLFMLAVALSAGSRRLSLHPAAQVILAAIIALWGSWPLLAPSHLAPVSQHLSRFMDLLVPLLLLPVALILAWRPEWLALQRAYLVRLSAGLLLAQSLWQVGATWQWYGYVNIWRGLMASHAGPVWLESTPFTGKAVGGQALQFDWFWSNPCMSIALSSDGQIRSLIMHPRPPFWQPFDPLTPEELPDLRRYGVDFSRYVVALEAIKAAAQRASAAAENHTSNN